MFISKITFWALCDNKSCIINRNSYIVNNKCCIVQWVIFVVVSSRHICISRIISIAISYTCVWILACIFLKPFMLDFLVTLKISFGIKFFSTCITLDVLMACSMHVKLPLVFEDGCLCKAFSTNTNKLTIPTYCVLCLLVVHQISLHDSAIVTITATEYFRIVTIVTSTSSVQFLVLYQTLFTLWCFSTVLANPSLSDVFVVHSLHVSFQVGES